MASPLMPIASRRRLEPRREGVASDLLEAAKDIGSLVNCRDAYSSFQIFVGYGRCPLLEPARNRVPA